MKKIVLVCGFVVSSFSFIPEIRAAECPPTAEEIANYRRLTELLNTTGLETAKQEIVLETITQKMKSCEAKLAAEREAARLYEFEKQKALDEWQMKLDEWKEKEANVVDPIPTEPVNTTTRAANTVEAPIINTPKTEAVDIVQPVSETTENIEEASATDPILEESKSNWVTSNILDLGKIGVPILTLFAGYFVTRTKRKKFTRYLRQAQNIAKKYPHDPKRQEAEFYRLTDILNEELHKGKIDEAAYVIVEKKIEEYKNQSKQADLHAQFAHLPADLKNTLINILNSGESTQQELVKAYAAIDQCCDLDTHSKNSCKDMVCHLHEKPKMG